MPNNLLKLKINELTHNRIAVDIEVPFPRCKASYQSALNRLSRSISLPGFRVGKVPKPVVIQQIGLAKIKASALEELIESSWKDAITQESLEPVAEAELKEELQSLVDRFNPDQSISFTLEVEISSKKKLSSKQKDE